MQTGHSLRSIEEGMKVFDRDRHHIGKVEYVKFGEDDPSTPEVESAQPVIDRRDDTLIDNLADAFAPQDEIPDELRAKLLLRGFVRLDADGLFASDRYIMPEQIETVTADGLTLNVSKKELLKH